ncbi:MAG: type II toxin-antitoxin system HicA family toxin [Rhodocyclaceae bacterium]|nr:type II toxin-antitoxin system HicA family toxin [Rhodocyclaceae bacterium]MDP3031959.1 type II toxin-antitoxin system HicA family toxin [Rhodocyclaceae bacterium]
MKLPRDLSGPDLIRLLAKLGYTATRQVGSYVRLTTQVHGEHHVTIPNHDPLRICTLASILAVAASHHGISREELLNRLLG